jgi:hypothetical protein
MADLKISQLTGATTPLAGTEVLPIVQNNSTKKVTVADLTAGRAVSVASLTASTGNIVIGTNGKGIDFSATPGTGTSELLNDYEEGTWTPAQGGGLVVVGAFTSSGTYTKIARQVTVSGRVQGATSVALSSGGILTNNLPFAIGSSGTGNAVDSTATKSSALIGYSGGSVQIYSASATTASSFVDFSLTYQV